MNNFREYWNERFVSERKIWGDKPSKSALIALNYFETRNIKSILVPGAGYGRNTKIFSDAGYKTIGVEISDIAIKFARDFDKKTIFIEKSMLDYESDNINYDAIYSYNILHLFLLPNRKKFLKNCYSLLKKKGFLFCVVLLS